MHKMMIMIAAAALAAPAAAQQTDPANATGNVADLNATGDAQMNGLATDPAMAPAPATTDPAYGTEPAREDRDFPWGLLGLAGLAGLLGRKRNDRDDTVRRDRA